jgi:glycosyltransferase involved in cell wall biosynthesis
MDSSPFFSVITVVRNGEKYIKETIESVISQSFRDFEYIIIDANSTDSTHEIVSEYLNNLAYYISEPDQNMYDGINKGLKVANGKYVLILNSDDILLNRNVFQNVFELINLDSAICDGYYFNIVINRNNMLIKKYYFQISFWILLYSQHCSFVPHSSLFLKNDVYSKTQGYDINYKYASDYDLVLKVLKAGFKLKHINFFTTQFREHPGSFTSNNVIESERIPIIKKYGLKKNIFSFLMFIVIWSFYKTSLAYKRIIH